jgi:hypothetical protein
MKGGKQPGAGRPKGAVTLATKQKMVARDILVAMIEAEIEPLGKVLIEKGKAGDISAIKELFDRGFGKSVQPIAGHDGKELKILFDHIFNATS